MVLLTKSMNLQQGIMNFTVVDLNANNTLHWAYVGNCRDKIMLIYSKKQTIYIYLDGLFYAAVAICVW